MALIKNFDATQVDPSKPFEVLPEGKYLVKIIESQDKQNSAKTGSYLELTFEIIDGKHRGARQWARLNLNHPNEMAVKIARADLSAICHAVNVLKPRDSVELHGLPLTIKVVCKVREDNGEIANEIKGYESKSAYIGQQQHTTTQAGTPAVGSAPNNNNSTPPWQR